MPSEIYNLPPLEREFIYQATLLAIAEQDKAAKKSKKGG